MGKVAVENILSSLCNARHSSNSIQRTALNAFTFTHREFVEKDSGNLSFDHSKMNKQILVVFRPKKPAVFFNKCKERQNS
jgi:hypothetical protein